MTTIRITIERDNSWDCEGDPLASVTGVWNTDGGRSTQETIAKGIATFLRTMSRTPVRAAPFEEVFSDKAPSREEVESMRAERETQRSEEFRIRMAVSSLLQESEGSVDRAALETLLFNEPEKIKTTISD